MAHKPTPQQEACVTAVCSAVIEMLKVEACAGSGKTSTLVLMAEANPVPSLYLAFNKVTATEGTAKFPKHVTCKTTHSVAYAVFGAKLYKKLSRPTGGYVNVAGTGSEIARFFHIESYENSQGATVNANFIGLLVKDTLSRFEQSADMFVDLKHIPDYELKKKLNDNSQSVDYVKKQVLEYANKLWQLRIDVESVVLATHDTYLKLYQMSKPVFTGYEILYVDEAQDSSPCVLDIVLNQKGKMKIVFVGDARQAIYGWRGAINAMQMVQCKAQHLTKSFRYGQTIADIATCVLERDMVITGNETIQSEAGLYNVVDESKPYTRLFRTNSALLYAAVSEIEKGTAISIEIDVKDFVKLLQSAVALHEKNKKQVKHEKLLAYDDWDEMVAESKSDAELGRIVKVVKEGLAERWCQTLERFKNSSNPQVTFTTAHKSKGREWKQVRLESDFKSCYSEDGDWIGLTSEEQNLLYVAVTRAIDKLEYNRTVQEYLTMDEAESPEQKKSQGRVTNILRQISNERGFDFGASLQGEQAQYAFAQQEPAWD